MHFKRIQLHSAVLLIAATYILHLGLTQQLNLYIHPRYITFTVIMAAIALTLVLLGYIIPAKEHFHTSGKLSAIPLFLVIIVAVFLPARTLTSATVTQRLTDTTSIIPSSDQKPLHLLFAGSSKGLKLADWVQILNSGQDLAHYTNKPAKISGFIYDANLGNDTVWVARFKITCCAVDAQPIGIPVQLVGWSAKYKEDEWVEISGSFRSVQTANRDRVVLVPIKVDKIDQPRNPYAE